MPSPRRDLGIDRLQLGQVCMETDGEGHTLLEHELVQGLERSGSTGLHLDWHDVATELGDIVDLGVARSAFTEPVGQLPVRPRGEEILQVLSDELLGRRPRIDQLGRSLIRERLPSQPADRVHQADVQKESA